MAKTKKRSGSKSKNSKSTEQERWFKAGEPTGWKKDLPQDKRIDLVLASRDYDYLASARALNALANVSQDPETKRKARADAEKLFKEYDKRKSAVEKNAKKGKNKGKIEVLKW